MSTITTSIPLNTQQTQRILELKNNTVHNYIIDKRSHKSYHLLFGFFDHNKQFKCNSCQESDRTNKYVYIQDNSICIFDQCMKNHPNEFLKGPIKDTPSDFAISCLKNNRFIENERNLKEITPIYRDITKESVINSGTGMQKKRSQFASPQLVIKRYLDNLLTIDDVLFYLQTIYKKEKSLEEADQLSKLNKIILLSYKYSDPQEAQQERKRKVEEYNGIQDDSSQPIKTRKVDENIEGETEFENPDTDALKEAIKEALEIPIVELRVHNIFLQHFELMSQWYQGLLTNDK